jgi:hypothetical protein
MKPVVKKATPAAIAVLRQATAICPLRKKASDGLLPSAAHISQSPNSDHNTGYAVDLTHDKIGGIDCANLFQELKADKRVKYLIFQGKIWSADRADQKGTVNTQGPISTTSIFTSRSTKDVEMTLPLGSLGWVTPKVVKKVKAAD